MIFVVLLTLRLANGSCADDCASKQRTRNLAGKSSLERLDIALWKLWTTTASQLKSEHCFVGQETVASHGAISDLWIITYNDNNSYPQASHVVIASSDTLATGSGGGHAHKTAKEW